MRALQGERKCSLVSELDTSEQNANSAVKREDQPLGKSRPRRTRAWGRAVRIRLRARTLTQAHAAFQCPPRHTEGRGSLAGDRWHAARLRA